MTGNFILHLLRGKAVLKLEAIPPSTIGRNMIKHARKRKRSMGRQDVLHSRLNDLGWTKYRLVQEVCKVRQARGDTNATVTRYQTGIYKALENPDNAKVSTIDDIVEAMGGEQVIRWNNPQEMKL